MSDDTRGVAPPLPDAPPRATTREWFGLAVLALPTLLLALDIGALFLALPELSTALGASGVEQLWISDIYGFMLAGFLITMGSIGDRIGRRRLLLIGGAAFGVASVVAAYAPNATALIAARALLGVAAATLGPSTLALITTMFRDLRQRGIAISLWMTCMMGGASLGPVVGGVLLEHFWWGSVFLLGVPAMLLLLVLGPIALPEHRQDDTGRLDLISVALSLAAILPLVYGVKEISASSPTTPGIVALLVGLLVGAVFARRQLSLTSPLLDLRLFGQRSFATVLAVVVLTSASMGGLGLLASQYLQSVVGLSPIATALWYAPMGLGVAAGTLLAPHLTARSTPAAVLTGGLALSLLGYLALALAPADGGALLVSAGVGIVGLGSGPVFVIGAGMIVGSVAPAKAGSAASLSETSNALGSTLGLAALGTMALAVFRFRMADGPAGAGESISRALSIAAASPSADTQLADAARAAYTAGLNISGALGGVVALGLLIATAIWRRTENQAGSPAAAGGLPDERTLVTSSHETHQ